MNDFLCKCKTIVLLGMVMLLAACNNSANTTSKNNIAKEATMAYVCEPIADITAIYITESVQLNIGGQNYHLTKIKHKEAGFSAIYSTEQGIDGENGMQWLVGDDEKQAKIRTLTLDHTATPEEEVVLYDCTVVDK